MSKSLSLEVESPLSQSEIVRLQISILITLCSTTSHNSEQCIRQNTEQDTSQNTEQDTCQNTEHGTSQNIEHSTSHNTEQDTNQKKTYQIS